MPVEAGDIKVYLTGGAANTDPNESRGGVISTTEVDLNTLLNNLWDNVSAAENAGADFSEYRCVALLNDAASGDFTTIKAYVATAINSDAVGLAWEDTINDSDVIAKTATEETVPSGAGLGDFTDDPAAPGILNNPRGSTVTIAPTEVTRLWFRRTHTSGSAAGTLQGLVTVTGETS